MTYFPTLRNGLLRNLLVLFFMLYSSLSWSQDYDATLLWAQKTSLGTVVSGVVDKVYVNVGDKVKKGSKLAQLDISVFKGRVVEFRAKLMGAREEFKEAERERDRALELYDRTVLSEHDLQVAKNNYVTAKAEYEKVRANLIEKEFDLKYSVVRAPFDAIILTRHAQPGQVIITRFKQKPVVIVAAADRMLARFLVTEDNLKKMTKGKTAVVSVDDMTINGKIRAIALELTTGQNGLKGYYVDVEFKVGEAVFRSGQTAKVNIE